MIDVILTSNTEPSSSVCFVLWTTRRSITRPSTLLLNITTWPWLLAWLPFSNDTRDEKQRWQEIEQHSDDRRYGWISTKISSEAWSQFLSFKIYPLHLALQRFICRALWSKDPALSRTLVLSFVLPRTWHDAERWILTSERQISLGLREGRAQNR